MSLTLITNPVQGDSTVFAGFLPIEFEFKREDLAIVDTEAGTGGVRINVTTDLTTYLSEGDSVYLYSEGTDYIYDDTGTILSITSTEITIDVPFIEVSIGGYINYFKNYYVEMQAVDKGNSDVNILNFTFESDGDAAGNITIDVSLANDLNRQRDSIGKLYLANSTQQFNVKYRQVYEGSSESFTVLDTKLLIVVYATETPEVDTILNQFDLPKIYLGYPAALSIAHEEGNPGDSLELVYNELDINNNTITSGTLGSQDSENGGLYLWEWDKDNTVEGSAKFVEFDFSTAGQFDFADPDFAYPDFLTQ